MKAYQDKIKEFRHLPGMAHYFESNGDVACVGDSFLGRMLEVARLWDKAWNKADGTNTKNMLTRMGEPSRVGALLVFTYNNLPRDVHERAIAMLLLGADIEDVGALFMPAWDVSARNNPSWCPACGGHALTDHGSVFVEAGEWNGTSYAVEGHRDVHKCKDCGETFAAGLAPE